MYNHIVSPLKLAEKSRADERKLSARQDIRRAPCAMYTVTLILYDVSPRVLLAAIAVALAEPYQGLDLILDTAHVTLSAFHYLHRPDHSKSSYGERGVWVRSFITSF